MTFTTGERLHKRLSDSKYVTLRYTVVPLRMHDITIPPNSWYTFDGKNHAVIADTTVESGYAPAQHGRQYG